MDIHMDAALGAVYHSPQQQARVITEAWAAENMYCVMCGAPRLEHLQNNKPVADLCCPHSTMFSQKSASSCNICETRGLWNSWGEASID